MASPIPASLGVNLKRFQQSALTHMKINFDRNTYARGDVMTVRLPSSGVIDLSTLAICGRLSARNDAGTSKTFAEPENWAEMFGEVKVLAGGVQLGLSAVSDYSYLVHMTDAYGKSWSKLLTERQLLQAGWDDVSNSVASGATLSRAVNVGDLLGFLSGGLGVRYLPLSLLPEITIQIKLNNSEFFCNQSSDYASFTYILNEFAINFQKVDFVGNLLEQLYSERVSRSPLELPFVNFTQIKGTTYTTGQTMTASIATNSLDYVMCQNQVTTINSYATTTRSRSADNDYLKRGIGEYHQLLINNAPYYSTPVDGGHFLSAVANAFDAGSSVFQPYIGSMYYVSGGVTKPFANAYQDFVENNWVFPTRTRLATEPMIDGQSYVTGLSTFGTMANISWTVTGGDVDSKIPVMTFVHTSIVEVLPNRQINLIN